MEGMAVLDMLRTRLVALLLPDGVAGAVDRGGKGMLIGGGNEFQEYAKAYYNIESSFVSDDMRKIASENLLTKKEIDNEREDQWLSSKPHHICVTNAAGPLAYSMISAIAQGQALGDNTEIALHLYDAECDDEEILEGISMEAYDMASPLLREVHQFDAYSLEKAFKGISSLVILDELVRVEDESDKLWLKRNYEYFANYGKVLNEVANKDVKVVVVGHGPVNLNTLAIIHNAPDIPRQNIVALACGVESSAKGILGQRLNVNSAGIRNVIIWGNINGNNYIDVNSAQVGGYDGAIWGPPSYTRPVVEMVHDNKWLSTDFLASVEQRRAKEEGGPTHAQSGALASVAVSMLRFWYTGSGDEQMFSLGVYSEGWYDLPTDMVVSLPVKFLSNGNYHIVGDFELPTEHKTKLEEIAKELVGERDLVLLPSKPPTPELAETETEQASFAEQAPAFDSDAEGEPEEKAEGEKDEKSDGIDVFAAEEEATEAAAAPAPAAAAEEVDAAVAAEEVDAAAD